MRNFLLLLISFFVITSKVSAFSLTVPDGYYHCDVQMAYETSVTNYMCRASIKVQNGQKFWRFEATSHNQWSNSPTSPNWQPLTQIATKQVPYFGYTCSATIDPEFGSYVSSNGTRLWQYRPYLNQSCPYPIGNPTCSITVDNNPVAYGASTTLHWSSTNATSLHIENVGYVNATGSTIVAPTSATSFVGTVVGPKGTSQCAVALNVDTSAMCPQAIEPAVSYTGYSFIDQAIYYFAQTVAPRPAYTLGSCGAPLPPDITRSCEISQSSSDGVNDVWTEDYDTEHTLWTNQPVKSYPYTQSTRVRCGYWNSNSSTFSGQSNWVEANTFVLHPSYGTACTATNTCGQSATGTHDYHGICSATAPALTSCSLSNACGQSFTGYQCASGCVSETNPEELNASCIQNFKSSSESVTPNGSAIFSWDINETAGVSSTCGFQDVTGQVLRPIPSLQNLPASIKSASINNIQSTTRFSLLCQFYNLGTGSLLGEAKAYQWIKVGRLSEE